MDTRDPLVALWHETRRPLNWRAWQGLSAAELARLCYLLTYDLQALEGAGHGQSWAWAHTHRELMELKAASGQARGEQSG
jgi:hypothetical protein